MNQVLVKHKEYMLGREASDWLIYLNRVIFMLPLAQVNYDREIIWLLLLLSESSINNSTLSPLRVCIFVLTLHC